MASTHSASRSRIACDDRRPRSGTTAASSGGLYGVGVCDAVSRRIGASRSSKPRVGDLGRDLGAEAERRERLVHDQQPARSCATEREDRLDVERRDACAGRSARPRCPRAASVSRGLQRLLDHQRQRDDGDVRALADDGRLAERDLVVLLGHRPLDASRLAVFEEEHRVVAAQGVREQPLGVVGRRRARRRAGRGSGRTSGSSCPSGASPPSGRCRCSRAAGSASSAGRCSCTASWRSG